MNTAAASQPAGGRRTGAVARQGRLVERSRAEVEAHPDPDQGQAPAPVGVLLAEQPCPSAHGPRISRPSATAPANAAIALTVVRTARANCVVTGGGLEPGQVGQQRGLDRLEELQRCPRDQQHVEHDPGQRPLVGGRVDRQHAAVEERLLGEHDPRHPDREEASPAQRELVVGGRLLHALGAGAGERRVGLVGGHRPATGLAASAPARVRAPPRRGSCRKAAGTTTSESSGAAAMPSATRVLAAGECRPPPRARSRSATATPSAPGRRTGRSAGGRPASPWRSSWRRRRACPRSAPRRAPRGAFEDVVDQLSCRQPDHEREQQREGGLDQRSARAAGAARARGPCVRRSSARAAVPPAGRSPR